MPREMDAFACKQGTKRLSLCMIVKNEEAYIGGCLNSVRDVVDEIIIVDTGSNDDTREICRSFGASVLEYAWNDDFAAARNHGLKHATGDWIFWLDADEEVDAADARLLRDAMNREDVDLFAFRLINYYSENHSLDESFQISHLRLFRNHKGIVFENKIHECLKVDSADSIITLPIRVHHYGYIPSVMKGKDKHTRNVQMLSRELTNPGYSPWIHYHLASELYNLEQLDAALQHLNVGILLFISSGLKPPAMCYRLKYTIHLQLKQVDVALSRIDKAIAIYPDYVDLYFIKGLLLFEQETYPEAESVFATCTTLGEATGDYLSLYGVGSFRAWYHRGQCLERMEQFEEAEKAYEHSISISPRFGPASEALSRLHSV